MKPIYLEVTRDKYELPVAVADSMWELARLRNVDVTTIMHALRCTKKSKYRVVWVKE